MAKKATEWDRMVGAKGTDEKAQILDRFRKLSHEEVDLAEKTLTKTLAAGFPAAARGELPVTMVDFAGLTKGDGKIQYDKYPVGSGASRLAKSMAARFSPSLLDAASTIDQKVKLLSQLESARCVLQNHPGGSTTSMDNEVRSRLRKINRVQMQVIDEILGSKADLTSDFVSELRPDKSDRKRFGVGEKRAGNLKDSKDTRRVIIELPEPDENGSRDITISLPAIEDDISSEGPVCTGATELCPKTSPDGLPFNHSYSPQPHIHYEHRVDLYKGDVPHYHQDLPPPAPAQDVYYPPADLPGSTYCAVHSQYAIHSPLLPPNCSVMTQGGFGFGRSVSNVGVGAEGTFQDGNVDENSNMVSRTVLILNRAGDFDNTGVIQGSAPQQAQLRSQEMAVQAGGGAGMQLVGVTSATQRARAAPSKRLSPSAADERFAKSCRESLREIADSVDDLIASLSTSDGQPGGLRRRRRSPEDDDYDGSSYDEDDDDYDFEDAPRRHRKGRSRSRGRRRTSVEERPGNSFWSWLCRGLRSVRDRSPCSRSKRDDQLVLVADRIRDLVQKVVQASNEVINARNAIQQGGVQGQMAVQSVLATERKLWELIEIERDLMNELAEYKALDSSSDSAYIESLNQAEEKIKRLIEVETQLAREIEGWRQMYQQTPFTRSYSRTAGYGAPTSSSSDDSVPRSPVYVRSSTSLGYMS